MRSTILTDLEHIALKYPHKIAYADLEEEFSFASVVEFSKRIGSFISNQIKPQNPIVIYMDKRAYNLIAFFGAVYAGCFYVPIDPLMPLER